MIVNLFSPDNSRDNLYLSNYATIQLKDELSRLPGVGDITYIGQRDYSMRLWLDPEKMAYRNLTANDVVTHDPAAEHAGGRRPDRPGPRGARPGVPVHHEHDGPAGRRRAVCRHDPQDRQQRRLVRVRDVAKIELGALAYDQTCTLDGQSSVALSIYQLPGSNALEGGPRRQGEDGGAARPASPTGSTTRSCTTRRRSSASRFAKSFMTL